MFRVTMVACVAGNPLKAWRGDSEPNDVWEDQSHPFDDLDAAKDFVRTLPEQTTTHVRIESDHGLEPDDVVSQVLEDGWVVIFDQDASGDHLDAAAPDVPMPHRIDSVVLTDIDDEEPEAPPLLPSQQGASQ